jgi:hypothetical protein
MTTQKSAAEVERIRRVLLAILAERCLSVRALERKAEVAEGSLRKVLHGGQHLSLRYLLLILDTLEIGRGGFFRTVFRKRRPAEVHTAPGGVRTEDSQAFLRSLVRLLEARTAEPKAEVQDRRHG